MSIPLPPNSLRSLGRRPLDKKVEKRNYLRFLCFLLYFLFGEMKRRTVLKALGVLGGLATIGAGSLFYFSNKSFAAIPAPNVELAEGWEKMSETTGTVFERSFLDGSIKLVAKQHLIQYQNVALREKIKEGTLDRIDRPVALMFASKINFNVPIDEFPVVMDSVVSEVRKKAKEELKDKMRNNGIEDITQVDSLSITIDTGESTNLLVFEGAMDVGEVNFEVKGTNFSFSGGSLPVKAYLATWKHGGYILTAGGLHPSQNYTKSISKKITEMIDISVNIDLGLEPSKYESEIISQIKSTR